MNNPIVFEERILDMKLRGKMLHHEIPKFVNQLKSKIEAEKKILNRIKQKKPNFHGRFARKVYKCYEFDVFARKNCDF